MLENNCKKIIDQKYQKYLVHNKYSSYQMYNFYYQFAKGRASMNDVMNYMQHLFIVGKCKEDSKILDVCCGRALTVPLLACQQKNISEYVGVDISKENLLEAERLIESFDFNISFRYKFILGNVVELDQYVQELFDIIIYTSSIEHMSREDGVKSLHQAAKLLNDQGTLFLSTPNTLPGQPNQYRCHVDEWYYQELIEEIEKCNLKIVDCIGLVPPTDTVLHHQVEMKYGSEAVQWLDQMIQHAPKEFWGPVMALEFPESSKEIMILCKKKL